jgi:hypothetical protein
VTSFRFSTAEEQFPTILGDPYMLHDPPFNHTNVTIPVVFSLAMLPYKVHGSSEDNAIFSGFAVNKDLSISQRIYSVSASENDSNPRFIVGGRDGMKLASRGTKSAFRIFEHDEMDEEEVDLSEEPALKEPKSQRRTNLADIYEYAFIQGEDAMKTAVGGEVEYAEKVRSLLEVRMQRGDLGIISL